VFEGAFASLVAKLATRCTRESSSDETNGTAKREAKDRAADGACHCPTMAARVLHRTDLNFVSVGSLDSLLAISLKLTRPTPADTPRWRARPRSR
jgi:hypothetical protein